MKKQSYGRLKKNRGQIGLHIFFILLSLCYVIPLILVVSASFTSEEELAQFGFSLFPKHPTLEAYKLVFQNPTQILNSYKTTIIFSSVSTFLAILVMGLMAYPLSRPTFVFRNVITFYAFFTMLFSAGMVPSYIINTKVLNLGNSIWIYILPGLVSAYNLIVIRTSYKSLPNELFESAKLDGAGELRICFQIVMPLCKATLASIGFLFLVDKWNNWSTAAIYIRDPELYSLQYLLQRILREAEYIQEMAKQGIENVEGLMPIESLRYAMAMVAAGPILVVFPLFQKHFTKGMVIGSVKG